MRSTLHRRLVNSTFIMMLAICLVFALGIYAAFENAEDTLFDTHRAREIAGLIALYERDPALLAVPQENFTVYVAVAGDTSALPAYLQGRDPRDDELVLDGREYDVQVEQRGQRTYFFLFDESAFEAFENALLASLIGLVIIIVIGAGWLSTALARRISRPLTLLADHVAALDGGATALAPPGPASDDEIALLAAAIDRYHGHVSELLNREREFSADVSHELRTPLMSIQGAAELLERRWRGDPDNAELCARVRRGCLQMTTLTEALLYLARDPASFTDMIEPVSVDKVIDQQIAAVREVSERRGIRISVERGAERATVSTIPAVINIVLGNILKNAVKYTDRNVITVFIEAGAVIIQDYGPGIDPSLQATLFDRFKRGDQRQSDGTGIGLALVRRFCDQYGWTIDFSSEQDKGTRVAVAF